jgi:hypothetical protein
MSDAPLAASDEAAAAAARGAGAAAEGAPEGAPADTTAASTAEDAPAATTAAATARIAALEAEVAELRQRLAAALTLTAGRSGSGRGVVGELLGRLQDLVMVTDLTVRACAAGDDGRGERGAGWGGGAHNPARRGEGASNSAGQIRAARMCAGAATPGPARPHCVVSAGRVTGLTRRAPCAAPQVAIAAAARPPTAVATSAPAATHGLCRIYLTSPRLCHHHHPSMRRAASAGSQASARPCWGTRRQVRPRWWQGTAPLRLRRAATATQAAVTLPPSAPHPAPGTPPTPRDHCGPTRRQLRALAAGGYQRGGGASCVPPALPCVCPPTLTPSPLGCCLPPPTRPQNCMTCR